jgi:hypothetical protein
MGRLGSSSVERQDHRVSRDGRALSTPSLFGLAAATTMLFYSADGSGPGDWEELAASGSVTIIAIIRWVLFSRSPGGFFLPDDSVTQLPMMRQVSRRS